MSIKKGKKRRHLAQKLSAPKEFLDIDLHESDEDSVIIDSKQLAKTLHTYEENLKSVTQGISDFTYKLKVERDGNYTLESITGNFFKYFDNSIFPSVSFDAVNRAIHLDDRKLVRRRLENLSNNQFDVSEYRIIGKKGEIYWLRDNGIPFLDANQKRVTHIMGVAQDITERKRDEEALRESEYLYKNLFELESDAVFLIDNETGCILEANKLAEQMYGYSHDEFMQLRNIDLSAEPQKTKNAISAGSTHVPVGYHKRKNQSVFPVEITANYFEFRRRRVQITAIRDITKRKQAEDALRDSDEKLRNIVENSTNLFYSRNTDQVFTYLSPQAKIFFDCEPNEALVQFSEFMTDNPINKFGWELANKAIQTGARQEAYELELLSRKGRRVWVEIQEAPVIKNGKAISIVGAATDITERRWAEMALQVSEKKYRDIVTWAPIGIYQSTRSGKLLSANSSIAKMLGYDNENECIGCNLGQDIYYEESDRERLLNQHDLLGENTAMSIETRWKKKDGSFIWVLMTVHDVRDKTGHILYYEGFIFDITERKYAEEALRESEERYRLLVENSTDLVTEISADGKFMYVSPNVKSILNYEAADLVGSDVLSKVYGKDKALLEEILSKQGGSAMYRYRDRTGDWHWFESSGKVYDTSSGERRMVMVSRDITQRQKAEQELEISRRQLQHFTEHLEHVIEEERKRISRELHDDLGQLLTILKFDLSWLRLEGAKGDASVIEKIDSMMDSLNEALASVKRISREIRPPQLDALGLSGALKWDIDQVEKKTGIKGIVTIEPTEFDVKGQTSTVLYRIFREALTNVVRHAQAQNVYIRLSQKASSVVLSVRDDGRGITKKELEGMASLGFVGIRERVRMIGGTLAVEGKTGKGTMLTVEVPLERQKNGESEL